MASGRYCRFVRRPVQIRIEKVLRECVVSIAGKSFPGEREHQSVDYDSDADKKRDERRCYERKDIHLVEGHEKRHNGRSQTDRRRDYACTNAAQAPLLGRLEKFLKLRQDIFRDFFEILRRTHLPDLVGHCHTDVFAC